jgi:hypothetical protein
VGLLYNDMTLPNLNFAARGKILEADGIPPLRLLALYYTVCFFISREYSILCFVVAA